MHLRKTLLSAAIVTSLFGLAACSNDDDKDTSPSTRATIELSVLGSYRTNLFDEGAAEIVAHDPVHQRLFVINAAASTVDVLDIQDPAMPSKLATIDASAEGASANSVAVHGDLVAVAIEAEDKQAAGQVVFYNATDLNKVGAVTVGALPDMVTFTPDGQRVLVANEGEPSDDYSNDPRGSVSIIDLTNGVAAAAVTTAGFEAFDGQEAELRAQGIRIFGPGASASQDFEPEYIAVAPDGDSGWVTLQENNAVAEIDLIENRISRVLPLGYKDHSVAGNELDPSNRDLNADPSNEDGAVRLANWPVLGMYQPDAIAAYAVAGQTYYVTANEGDARDYDGFSEELRIKDLTLADGAFADLAGLQEDHQLGRLKTTWTQGISNDCDPYGAGAGNYKDAAEADCEFDTLYAYGARSFSIWSASGELVFDSGSAFETITAEQLPAFFNATNDDNNFDNRSDDKGPEPEGVTVGQINGQTFAFIGLERVGGIMVYDISTPQAPTFVQYLNNRDFSVSEADLQVGMAGDLGPEGLAFISAADSPTGAPLLAVGNEVSGSTTLYAIAVSEVADE
ncbi:choice-of-anchor I family protein [Marinobacter xestospongiae]|uniref:choice-of-anchor I family protein n=1 Tax=Marinobacter xestospongiae TaxID=994319 RepID=UPI002005F611|nr:choice-of-anchor I family protein [Marinobacter xestospongiae]MCK7566664.1 choice-of-anchor I family protein [Marinobacter xestospongiae]